MSVPAVQVAGVQATPLAGGLYAAATLVDSADARHLGGIQLEPVNTGVSGRWPADVSADTSDLLKQGSRPEWLGFGATVVWASDEVKSVGTTDEGGVQRAEHLMRLLEPVEVEDFVAEQLSEFSDADPAMSLKDQLGLIEEELGRFGRPGVVHARRGSIPHLNGLIVRQGSSLLTPGGHRWVFGAGYGSLGNDLVGTGPVTVQRSPVQTRQVFDRSDNVRATLSERVVAVGWEGPEIRVPLSTNANRG